MALIYTAQTSRIEAMNTGLAWRNINETHFMPSPASMEARAKGKFTLTQQRDMYFEWLDARAELFAADLHNFLSLSTVVLASQEAQPSADFRGWAVEWLARTKANFRYGGELVSGRINKVIVSGTREPAASLKLMGCAQKRIFPYLKSGYRLVVGDANGVDVTVQMVASEDMKAIMEIWWPGSVGIRYHPLDPKLWIPKPTQHPSDDARIQYIHRTKEMVLSGDPEYNRDVFLAFWDGQSKGTKAAIIQARKMGYDHGYVFVETANNIQQIDIKSPDLEPWLIVR